MVKNLPATQETQETQAQSLGREDPLGFKDGSGAASWISHSGCSRVKEDNAGAAGRSLPEPSAALPCFTASPSACTPSFGEKVCLLDLQT